MSTGLVTQFNQNQILSAVQFAASMGQCALEEVIIQGSGLGGVKTATPVLGAVFGPDHRDRAAEAIAGIVEYYDDSPGLPLPLIKENKI